MAKCPIEGDCEISLRREAQLQPWRAQSQKACLLSSLFGTQISDILSALDQSNVENTLGIYPSALGEKKHIHWTLSDMLPTTVSRTDVRLVGYWTVSLSCAHTRKTSAKTCQICLALSRKKILFEVRQFLELIPFGGKRSFMSHQFTFFWSTGISFENVELLMSFTKPQRMLRRQQIWYSCCLWLIFGCLKSL